VTPEDIIVTFDIVSLFTKVPTGDALRAIPCQTRQRCNHVVINFCDFFILQIDVHEVEVFQKFKSSAANKSVDIN
jgi:hypothetical protein